MKLPNAGTDSLSTGPGVRADLLSDLFMCKVLLAYQDCIYIWDIHDVHV